MPRISTCIWIRLLPKAKFCCYYTDYVGTVFEFWGSCSEMLLRAPVKAPCTALVNRMREKSHISIGKPLARILRDIRSSLKYSRVISLSFHCSSSGSRTRLIVDVLRFFTHIKPSILRACIFPHPSHHMNYPPPAVLPRYPNLRGIQCTSCENASNGGAHPLVMGDAMSVPTSATCVHLPSLNIMAPNDSLFS